MKVFKQVIIVVFVSIIFVGCHSLQPPKLKFVGTTEKLNNGERLYLKIRKNGSASILKETSESKVYRYNYTYKILYFSGGAIIQLECTGYDGYNFIKDYGDIKVKYKWRWYSNGITLRDRYNDNKIQFYPSKNHKNIK